MHVDGLRRSSTVNMKSTRPSQVEPSQPCVCANNRRDSQSLVAVLSEASPMGIFLSRLDQNQDIIIVYALFYLMHARLIPYHRIYSVVGPSGAGKSSVC
jgi:hypothetical protein